MAKVSITLWFENEEQKSEFLGQLSDGFGEGFIEIVPTDKAVIENDLLWDVATEFDVKMVEFTDAATRYENEIFGEDDDD